MLGTVHIPDGFLSAGVAATTWAGAAGSLGAALTIERREARPAPSGVLGALAAFVFAAQLVNVPVAPGTSGHLVGATLASLLVGPWRALVVMGVVLGIQALLFQDGGLTSLGANLLDMGVAAAFVGYAVAVLVARVGRGVRGIAAGGVVGAFAATLAGATLTALWLGVSGLYPLRVLLPVLLVSHAAIGLLEAALTGGILVTILKWRPDLVQGLGSVPEERRPAALAVGLLGVALVVAAFIAPYASSLPDGLDRAALTLGFAAKARASWPAPLAGYRLPFASSLSLAPALAGLIGTAAAAALAWIISKTLKPPDDALHR